MLYAGSTSTVTHIGCGIQVLCYVNYIMVSDYNMVSTMLFYDIFLAINVVLAIAIDFTLKYHVRAVAKLY